MVVAAVVLDVAKVLAAAELAVEVALNAAAVVLVLAKVDVELASEVLLADALCVVVVSIEATWVEAATEVVDTSELMLANVAEAEAVAVANTAALPVEVRVELAILDVSDVVPGCSR